MDTELLFVLPKELPTRFALFQFGKTETSKGDFYLDQAGADSILANFAAHGADRLPFDVGHNMLTGSPDPSAHMAFGWFIPAVELDETTGNLALFATDVQWTERGAEMLNKREVRFFSPAIHFDAKRRITKLTNVALTNLPATRNQRPLVLSDETAQIDKEKRMQVLLDCLDSADEAGAVAKVSEFKAELSRVNQELQSAVSEAIEANAQLAALGAQVEAEKAEAAKALSESRRAGEIESLLNAGKLFVSQKSFAASLSDEQFAEFSESLVSHRALSLTIEDGDQGAVKLSQKTEGADFRAEDLFHSIGEK